MGLIESSLRDTAGGELIVAFVRALHDDDRIHGGVNEIRRARTRTANLCRASLTQPQSGLRGGDLVMAVSTRTGRAWASFHGRLHRVRSPDHLLALLDQFASPQPPQILP